ncbi:MAG: hypothetical protein ABJG41_08920 [Cyclobacteriaceae bacterium]
MRIFIIAALLVTSFVSHSQDSSWKSSSVLDSLDSGKLSIEGIWELVDFDFYEDDVIVSSAPLAEGYVQHKIFIDGHVMWSRQVPNGESEWYGFGSYEIKGDTLIERLEYGSHALKKTFKTDEHRFLIDLDEKSYRQINFKGYRNFKSSENYRRKNEEIF